MAGSVLSRYLDPDVLTRLAGRALQPRGLVLGGLAGGHRSPLSGFAVEFAGHREYAWGDDPRHIDWRLYFTRDKLFIKQYETDTNFVCHIALDSSASMSYGEGRQQKFEYAAGLAAVMAYAVVRQRDQASFTTFDDSLRAWLAPGNSPAQLHRIAEHLGKVSNREKTNLGRSLSELAGRTRRREVVMVFSDFLGDLRELESAVQELRYRQHEVVLFQVMHRHELTFDLDGARRFRGLEDGAEIPAQSEDIRREYLAELRKFQTELDAICARNRAERVLVDTSSDPAERLLDYLNQRSQVRRGR